MFGVVGEGGCGVGHGRGGRGGGDVGGGFVEICNILVWWVGGGIWGSSITRGV